MKTAGPTAVLIGAGNVATHLGAALQKAGFEIATVYSRTDLTAQRLAAQLNTSYTTSLTDLPSADLYLISVKDDALPEVAKELKVSQGIVAHTCGSIGMDVLEGTSAAYGVLYPLQTFSQSRAVNTSQVPFCVEGCDAETASKLEFVARAISGNVHLVDSEQRRVLHVAAVFACNFTNHMYALADEILKKKNIPFNILFPLIEETAARVKDHSPREVQTGPAVRDDQGIMQRHIELLADDETMQAIYKLISYSIGERK